MYYRDRHVTRVVIGNGFHHTACSYMVFYHPKYVLYLLMLFQALLRFQIVSKYGCVWMGGPIYVNWMTDRWAWLAHGPQMCCFLPVLHCSGVVLGDSMSC